MDIKREHKINFSYVIAAFFAVLLIQEFLYPLDHMKTIPYSEFQTLVEQGKVTDLVVGTTQITGTYKEPVDGRCSISRQTGSSRRSLKNWPRQECRFPAKPGPAFSRPSSSGSCRCSDFCSSGCFSSDQWLREEERAA